MRYHSNKGDVAFHSISKKRKTPIAWSTKSNSDFLVIISQMYSECTIKQIRDILCDKSQWLTNHEAIAVLDAYIKSGDGDFILSHHIR